MLGAFKIVVCWSKSGSKSKCMPVGNRTVPDSVNDTGLDSGEYQCLDSVGINSCPESDSVLCPHVSGLHQDRKVFVPYL